MKALILSIYIFVVFKLAPRTIDNKSHNFWIKSVNLLNKLRAETNGKFYLFKIGGLYIRDPHAYPIKNKWVSSNAHPFCWRKS